MRILVLGGYGLFGGRIARTLAADGDKQVLVAGRDAAQAQAFIDASGVGRERMRALALDAGAADLATKLARTGADLLVHSAGPFQGQDYAVARAALRAGLHYVDLADARGFVEGFDALDAAARAAQRLAITGASSVPGASAAAVRALLPRFSRLDAVETAIFPGNRTPRGLATTRAILSYAGKPYRALIGGRWRNVHGWQSLRRMRIKNLGVRWLARFEAPDLGVLPARYPTLRTCDTRTGLELHRMHFGLWLSSWLVRARLLPGLLPFAKILFDISNRWIDAGSDAGGIRVELRGLDPAGEPLALHWTALLRDGHGPQFPCTAAIVLARKLARGELPGSGAQACLDLFTLDEFVDALADFGIETSVRAS
ncbi:MAG: saccharopine dehydrogenase NADP-binding domain-containing protein [Pseudoxanthomonas sp.]